MLLRLPCLMALLLATMPAAGAELRLLTPGLAYCDELSARYARLPRARQDIARSLAAEGARLCREGNIRTGVARLRRALRAAQPDAASPPLPEPPSPGTARPILPSPEAAPG
ncbi:hypothetical protein NON00_16195 [Roseomonas sp. GC11]|uniref:hypothetical protein n=1 Tax=Roseomonas sp. GC11 TaxID=2950546 RepID=UPI0021091426|nr:hypothetical protein [Roseomonas sp. GC11]MCQ4161461.1 hypothetical protein [Roseomonas sp. GC11]